jgi:radical SAM protein with 4Fe4S-binding SPASM domain
LAGEQVREALEWVIRRQAAGPLELKATCAPQYARLATEYLKANPGAAGAERIRAMLRGRGCQAGTGVIFVACDGEVFPCGYLPVSCGNVLRTDLREIWNNSPVLRALRDLEGLSGKCGRCDYKRLCAGCRARALAATGDYLSEEPWCDF